MPFSAKPAFKPGPLMIVAADGTECGGCDGCEVLGGKAALWSVNAGQRRCETRDAILQQHDDLDDVSKIANWHRVKYSLRGRS